MAKLILNEYENEFEEGDDLDVINDDILNYKGYFLENEEEEDEPKYYEYGAHFPYLYLYQKLEILQEERKEEEEKNKKKEEKENDKNNDTLQNIFNNFTGKSRNRNNNEKKNGLTFIPKGNRRINEDDKKIDEIKVKENSNSGNSIHINKDNGKNIENNKQKKRRENLNLYSSFTSKLKMNKHLNYSKKEDEDNLKKNINNKTISTTSKKIKSIQLSKDHLNKILNSTHQKNKLEKKIKSKDNSNNNTITNFKKTNEQKNKELSTSFNNNLNNKENKLITSSLNNIVQNYKTKNINFKPSSNSNPTKITQKNDKKNNNNPLSRNYNIIKNANNTKNISNKVINNSKFFQQNKKKLTISIEGKDNINDDKKLNKNNNFKEMLLSITNANNFTKSRNKNTNLTNTKSNIMTDRDKNSQNLTLQNHLNNNFNAFNKNVNNHLQTLPVYPQKKKMSQNNKDKNQNPMILNQKKNKQNYLNGTKSKASLDGKIDLSEKTQNKLINEIKKTIYMNNTNKNLTNKIENNKKQNQKNLSQSKLINPSITRNRPTTAKYSSKTTSSNFFNHQKVGSNNSNNINININNSNKIIDIGNKKSNNNSSKNKGMI